MKKVEVGQVWKLGLTACHIIKIHTLDGRLYAATKYNERWGSLTSDGYPDGWGERWKEISETICNNDCCKGNR